MLSLLCAVTVMTLDAAGGEDSPVQPLRTGAVAVFGPLQTGAAAVFDPVVGAVETIGELRQLRDENAALQERNDELAAELATTELDRNRLAEYDALSEASAIGGFDLVPARVVAVGPAQAFARTVTIDAGAADGVRDDLTVVAAPGLVLLAVDAGSVIGAASTGRWSWASCAATAVSGPTAP